MVSGPIPGTTVPDGYARALGAAVYVWAWPMVNMHNRREAFDGVPQPGRLGGIVPVAPVNEICMLTDYVDPGERMVATPNQDVIYGYGILSLDREPVVVQIPDFGGRFWVYQAADQRTDAFAQLGSMYGTRPGHYLLTGPGWSGALPPGIAGAFASSTAVGALIPRLFVDDTAEDKAAVQPLIEQIAAFPLSRWDGTSRSTDWAAVPDLPAPGAAEGETSWVDPTTFFDVLPQVLVEVPPLPGEEAWHAQALALATAAANDTRLRDLLRATAADAESTVLSELFQWRNQGIRLPYGWTTMRNAAQWGTDYLTRTSAARANIFSNAPRETLYFALDDDDLAGDATYTMTFGDGVPPVRGFWSLTAYNAHHFFEECESGRYSIGTKNSDLATGADGSLTITISAEPPADPAARTNWLPAPRGRFSLYLRAYWPDEVLTRGRWTPPSVDKV